MSDFPIIDKRGRTASGLQAANFGPEMTRLRQANMPRSNVQARLQAKQMEDLARTPGSFAEATNPQAAMRAQMRRSRMANHQRTGSNVQLAMPKIRQPLGTLMDKGVPIDVSNPEELKKARMWARMYYATHDLVPLLIDIYSRFPLTGLEFHCEDPRIEQFFSEMFLNDLDYENFLPNAIGREYFIAGEVTTLGHFDERLGTWASEEVLNPDFLRVSKSIFVQEERVQLLVKDLVEGLRNPAHSAGTTESRSEAMERTKEYELLAKHHPEMIAAASQDDGLDISEGLWSRMVNKVSDWDVRGTPPLMRSFGTLLEEESLRAAQDAVADRLYAPFVLATLGIENMGDGEPWIPSPEDLDALRDDMQSALMADFKFYAHHMGLKVESVFGRESVPRFDQDFQRLDMKLMQAWGIGQALIMGGTAAAGTYASSALNREVCELNMKDFQRKAIRHINKRMEVIAEAQEFFAYEKKGGTHVPIYEELVSINPETGEEEVVRAPKLLLPRVSFRSLNLRDEATERQFYMDLRGLGIPISDKTLAINLDTDFDREIQRASEETVDKLVAEAEAMAKAKSIIDAKNLQLPVERQIPYPPSMIEYLNQTLVLRQQMGQTKLIEGQADMMEEQAAAMSPAGQMGLLPPPPQEAPPPGERPREQPQNRARPEVSDDMRAGMPRAAARQDGERSRKPTWLERGPSSYRHAQRITEERVEQAVRRREVTGRTKSAFIGDLVADPGFFEILNSPDEAQIVADWPEIQNGRAPESRKLLEELAEQWEYNTGIRPEWDE